MEIKNGYKLWLGYEPLNGKNLVSYRQILKNVTVLGTGGILDSARRELETALPRLLNTEVSVTADTRPGLVIGTADLVNTAVPEFSNIAGGLKLSADDGYWIAAVGDTLCISSPSEKGVLYGVFGLLRMMQEDADIQSIKISDSPKLSYRMLNHWDDLDGTIERGYAGKTLWQWDELPDVVDPRYTDYARACASVGINASAINNVNAAPEILTREYLVKVAAIADVLRAYGILTFLSVNFGSPKAIGGLDTADPLDPAVADWWKEKTDEIYSLIPDFGGYLVKADSEGQPGPYSYGRDHAQGANMLAAVLKPHNGIVVWRAFVYGHGEADRANKAYVDFKPHDGEFLPNAAVQIKNGAIDFQPREPVHPMFGRMNKTAVFMEFQIAQEYLGQGNHIVYLGPMWKEILDFDTKAEGDGSTVGKLLEQGVDESPLTGIAAVANSGDDTDWCGSQMHPLNWYAYGRLAWDHTLDPGDIAAEWIRQTFGTDDKVFSTLLSMLMGSWEACVDYMMPLCLHHIMKEHHHYGPDPAFNGGKRADWRSTYYHKADSAGLGFDRTRKGSGHVDQYHIPVADMFDNIKTCPEKYLLWFHHVPWDYILESGRTLKDELVYRYHRGVLKAENMLEMWESLKDRIDEYRFNAVRDKLIIQAKDAREWEDVCTGYFLSFTE